MSGTDVENALRAPESVSGVQGTRGNAPDSLRGRYRGRTGHHSEWDRTVVTWLATLLAVVGIAAATYVAVTAHWRCDRIERQLATEQEKHGRHRG